MKIIVNPHNVRIIKEETEPINELEVNISKCEFEFAEEITNDFTKEAYFTLNGNTYKQTIIDNECDYPSEVLVQSGTLEVGVVAYKVVNGQELIRYNPTSDYFSTWEGSLKEADNTEPITPTDKEQMQSQISQNTSNINNLQANKQDKLTAGDNITIENNVISAVDTIYDDTEIKADIQELQEIKVDKDVNNLTYYTLTTETGSKITLSIDSSTYIMTLKLKDKNNNDISTANVDLPLETMVVGARYDSATKEIVLTLKNGQEVRFSVADLVSGLQTEITENNKLSSDLVDDTNNTNKFVSASEKEQITTNKNDITAIKDGQSIDSFSDVETALNLKEDKSNKVTEINSSSTDTQYPSAKCVYVSQEEQNEQIAELEMLYNAFPTVSDENETIQLDNTAKVKFREIDLKGNTSQVVIPEEQGTIVSNTSINVSDVNTDKEHTIEMSGNTYQKTTTGKQLLNFTDETSTYLNVTKTTQNGIITLNGTPDSTNYNLSIYRFTATQTGTYTLLPFKSETNTHIRFIYTINNGSYISDDQYTQISLTSGDVLDIHLRIDSTDKITNFVLKPMLYFGTDVVTSWEEYSGGQPSPNPSYPQNIEVVTGTQNVEVCGKNLIDLKNGTYYSESSEISALVENGEITLNGTTTATRFAVIPLNNNINWENGISYTISAFNDIANSNIKIRTNIGGGGDITLNAINKTATITYDTSVERYNDRIVIRIASGATLENYKLKPMIEKGSTATTYEQYQGTTYPVNLGNIELCKIDTYQDKIYKRNDKWYLEKNIDKVVLNGSESGWEDRPNYNNADRFVRTGSFIGQKSDDKNGYSNYFKIATSMTNTYPYIYLNNGQCVINYSAKGTTTLEQFKTWLSTHNTIVYYVLATPTTTEITDTTLVNQLNALYNATIYSTTNINTDTSNLLPYIDLHYNFVTPSPSPNRPSNISVVKGNNTITISNSDNTESQVFPINIGDMELCKIGTYQDYIYENNGNWYKKGNVGKVIYDGSNDENWKPNGQNENYGQYYIATSDKEYGLLSLISNNFIISSSATTNCIRGSASTTNIYLTIAKSIVPYDVNNLKSWLSSNNTIVYYNCTPTDTQITDTTLITQLNNIKKAYSYDTQTNISQTNTDKPFIIYAEAIRSLKDVFE